MPRLLRVGSPALLLVAAVAAMLVALAIGGGITGEAAAWVTTGVPTAQLVIDLAASVTLGPLLLASHGRTNDPAARLGARLHPGIALDGVRCRWGGPS